MIHPTAIVHPQAALGANVSVGAYSIVGEHVEIGDGTEIGPHTIIEGPTRIGRDNRIGSFTALGGPPQDKSYRGEPTRLEIGDRNTIREYCTFNRGTMKDARITRVGDDNWIMGYVHLAHDCQIGNNTVLANSTQLAGHVHIGDWAILGGFTGVHQFVRIGAHAMIGGGTMLRQDVPPYVTVAGNPPKAFGVNSEGLRRRAFTPRRSRRSRPLTGRSTARGCPSRTHKRRSRGTRPAGPSSPRWSIFSRPRRAASCGRGKAVAPVRIAIVAGEASGDLLGSRLIETLRRRIPAAVFSGIGGPRMIAGRVRVVVPAGEARGARLRRGAAPSPRDPRGATRASPGASSPSGRSSFSESTPPSSISASSGASRPPASAPRTW